MYTYPSAVINHVTYTALRWGQFPTITYSTATPAGHAAITAGHEYVLVATDLSNITIYIEDGASTNAQIKAAIIADDVTTQGLYARDLISGVIAGGHTTDTNVAVTATALAGAVSLPPSALSTVGALDFTNVSADIGTTHALPETTIAAPRATGMYLLSFYGLATTDMSGADAAPNLYMAWTDERGTQKCFTFAGTLDGTYTDGPNALALPIYVMGGTPVWMYTSAGNYSGTVKWSFHFTVTQL